MRSLKNLLQTEQGFVLVFVSAVMVMLLASVALVTDIGKLLLEKARISHACDAAALAAAYDLPSEIDAKQTAVNYALANGGEQDEIEATVSLDKKVVSVAMERQVDFIFAKILGFNQGTVTAKASAAIGGVKSMTGVAPLAVPDWNYEFGKEYLIKVGPLDENSLGPGNFHALSLGGNGAATYEENLKHGFAGSLEIGDWVKTETGNMSGGTRDGVGFRLSQCHDNCTPSNFTLDCPKIIYIPVYEIPDNTEKQVKEVKIIKFAAFMLSNLPGNGNDSQIYGCFIKTIPGAGVEAEIDLNIPAETGLAAAKLIY